MVTRLDNGLLPEQAQFLQELQVQPDWKKACDALGISHGTYRRWIREDTAFRAAYNSMHEGVIDAVRAQLEATAQKAAEVFDEAVGATRDITVEFKCPHCNGAVKITAEVPDWNTRMRAGEISLKVAKILKDVKEVGGTVTIAQLPLHLQLAWAAFKRDGRDAIPPASYDELVQYGIIKGELALPRGEVTEAVWNEVTTSDEHKHSGDRVEGVS